MPFKFVVNSRLWFDEVNGNTYHSCTIIRTKDKKFIYAPFQYGYGSAHKGSAIVEMIKAKWIPKKYTTKNMRLYESENDYPIFWNVTSGTKRECKQNGGVL